MPAAQQALFRQYAQRTAWKSAKLKLRMCWATGDREAANRGVHQHDCNYHDSEELIKFDLSRQTPLVPEDWTEAYVYGSQSSWIPPAQQALPLQGAQRAAGASAWLMPGKLPATRAFYVFSLLDSLDLDYNSLMLETVPSKRPHGNSSTARETWRPLATRPNFP